MSERLGDASGRIFTDYRTPSLRNDEFARRNGIDLYDTHGFRQALTSRPSQTSAPPAGAVVPKKGFISALSNLWK